jgi:hypothetical protein
MRGWLSTKTMVNLQYANVLRHHWDTYPVNLELR